MYFIVSLSASHLNCFEWSTEEHIVWRDERAHWIIMCPDCVHFLQVLDVPNLHVHTHTYTHTVETWADVIIKNFKMFASGLLTMMVQSAEPLYNLFLHEREEKKERERKKKRKENYVVNFPVNCYCNGWHVYVCVTPTYPWIHRANTIPSWPSRVFWHLYVVQVSQTLKAKAKTTKKII